jgi:hypothetical protein
MGHPDCNLSTGMRYVGAEQITRLATRYGQIQARLGGEWQLAKQKVAELSSARCTVASWCIVNVESSFNGSLQQRIGSRMLDLDLLETHQADIHCLDHGPSASRITASIAPHTAMYIPGAHA